jgi:uncharacterized protein
MTTFSLRQLRLRSGEQVRRDVEVELEPLVFGGERYEADPGRVGAVLAITQATTGRVFELRLHVTLRGPCQRCLVDAALERDLVLREYQASEPGGDEDLRSPYVDGDALDLSSWARDALALSLPAQILHTPDCAGLCPVCGKDLNVEPHEHVEERADPRWGALAQLRERL